MSALTAKSEMLIRKPVAEVFNAFIDPQITGQFWFTRGSAPLEAGKQVEWHWEMYGASATVDVKVIEPNRRILIEWPSSTGQTAVEWTFTPHGDDATFVSISNTGFQGDDAAVLEEVIASTEAFALVLAGLKALLEHGIRLNLVVDRFPAGLTQP